LTKEVLPYLVISVFVFGCFEKTTKERFVINHTNEKTRKFLLALLDKQSSGQIIIKENCDILFYNQAVFELATSVMKMKNVPINFLNFIDDSEEDGFDTQEHLIKQFVNEHFACFKAVNEKPSPIEICVKKAPLGERDYSSNLVSEYIPEYSPISIISSDDGFDFQSQSINSHYTSLTSDFFLMHEIIRIDAQPFFYKDQKTLILTLQIISSEKAQA